MAIIGHGYGSEWHLLRWMGRHRKEFDSQVLAALNCSEGRIDWEDHLFRKHKWADEELEGLDFLPDPAVQAKWKEFWPSSGSSQNWDAVGWIQGNQGRELLLVEAKAHLGEVASNCGASEKGGLGKITQAFDQVKRSLGVVEFHDWLTGYYQYANRLAVLHFLNVNRVPAHLLMIYFLGDESDSRRKCPATVEDWNDTLTRQQEHLGLPAEHPLKEYTHTLFLPIALESSAC